MNVSVNIYIQAFVAEYLSGRNASQNRIGRLMLREDGTGAIEYCTLSNKSAQLDLQLSLGF